MTVERKNENSHSVVNNLSRSAFFAGKKCEQAGEDVPVIFRLIFASICMFRNDAPIFMIVTLKVA